MTNLLLSSSEQEVIDKFCVNLMREDIDIEENKKIIETLLQYPRFGNYRVNNSCSDLFKTKNNTFFIDFFIIIACLFISLF